MHDTYIWNVCQIHFYFYVNIKFDSVNIDVAVCFRGIIGTICPQIVLHKKNFKKMFVLKTPKVATLVYLLGLEDIIDISKVIYNITKWKISRVFEYRLITIIDKP